ncbi:DUF2971 domain-containing protein [Niveibacterium terrae]|uniref:DUF2971 domain-containing protein n=1 Tax=Niveibacterium terrae TaxID=3373598 RepID=UPI003A90DD43
MSEDQGVFVANTVFVDQTGTTSCRWADPPILYKYRQPSLRSLESLCLEQIWFAQPKTFNDPFESSKFMDEAVIEEMLRKWREDGGPLDKEKAKKAVDIINREIDESGIFCLCRTADNLAMWSYYGKGEDEVGLKGFAVGYDLVRLFDDLDPLKKGNRECTPRNRYVLEVAYRSELDVPNIHTLIDSVVEKKGLEFQKMHATKATDFAHEGEVRIVIPPSVYLPPKEKAWSGHGAYRHARGAIREIVFGELIEPVHEEMIRKSMAGRDVVFKRAIRDPKTMGIVLESESGRNET